MPKNFRTYDLAVEFHRSCRVAALPDYLKDQLLRASSSIALNLAEGNGRYTTRDRGRFFQIAMGSLRESQSVLDLSPKPYAELSKQADVLGVHLYRLCQHKLKK